MHLDVAKPVRRRFIIDRQSMDIKRGAILIGACHRGSDNVRDQIRCSVDEPPGDGIDGLIFLYIETQIFIEILTTS